MYSMLVMVLLVVLAGWLDARLDWTQFTDERKEKTK